MNTLRKVGNLMLVEVNKQPETGDLLRNIKDYTLFILLDSPISHANFQSKRLKDIRYKVVQPIIICDDEIQVGDYGYDEDAKRIFKCGKSEDVLLNILKKGKKILVLDSQLSSEFKQAIVDGKVKDGDKVEVEMYLTDISDDLRDFGYYGKPNYKEVLNFRKDGTAIIHPYNESVEEAAEKLYSTKDLGSFGYPAEINKGRQEAFIAGAKWMEEKLKSK
jgi:hypothetical protein